MLTYDDQLCLYESLGLLITSVYDPAVRLGHVVVGGNPRSMARIDPVCMVSDEVEEEDDTVVLFSLGDPLSLL